MKHAQQEQETVGKFEFDIHEMLADNGDTSFVTRSVNKNIPLEVIIMEMRAFLYDLEEHYFNDADVNE